MLTSIRTTFAHGFGRWILTALMMLLIASFGIWGIQDVFRGGGNDDVVSVGATSISTQRFQTTYRQEVQQVSRRAGRPITAIEAQALGVDKQVVGRLVAGAALDEQAHALGLGLAPEKIAFILMDDPQFKTPGGQFDRTYLNALLRNSGTNEAAFLAEQSKVYVRNQIGSSLSGEVVVPAAMQEAIARYGAETRSVAFITLTDALLGDIGKPDDAALKAFFEERKSDFRTPELRKLTYVSVTPEDLAAKVAVTDDDAKADYDSRLDRYSTPEKRSVQQIAFANEADAKAAADRIAAGQATFDAIAAERKIAAADLDLGVVTKAQLLDPAIADAAFALKQDAPSGVVKGRVSSVILRVTRIDPGVVTPFETVKDKIKSDLALSRAGKEILDIRDKIEDERSGGAPLKEIAAKFGLQATEVPAIDRDGRDAAGKATSLPEQAKLVPAVFANEPGSDSEAIDGREAGLIWFSVDAVTPARDRTLDEARPEVVAAWTVEEASKRLKDRAEAMVKDLGAGKSLDEVAKAAGIEPQQAWNLKRNAEGQGLSTAAVNQVFAVPVKGSATALSGTGTDRIVFQVTESIVPPFDPKSPDAAALEQQLSRLIEQDLLSQYVLKLQSDLGLTINQVNLNRALGVGGEG